jgi:hypothetical protein
MASRVLFFLISCATIRPIYMVYNTYNVQGATVKQTHAQRSTRKLSAANA